MSETLYAVAAIAVVALVTWGLRAVPFLLFGSRPLPKTMRYLGKALPPAIMTVLVFFSTCFNQFAQRPPSLPPADRKVRKAADRSPR